MRSTCSMGRRLGVPPPKKTVGTGRPRAKPDHSPISAISASTYGSTSSSSPA